MDIDTKYKIKNDNFNKLNEGNETYLVIHTVLVLQVNKYLINLIK